MLPALTSNVLSCFASMQIHAEGGRAIARAMRHINRNKLANRSCFASMQIHAEGGRAIARAMRHNNSLVTLNL